MSTVEPDLNIPALEMMDTFAAEESPPADKRISPDLSAEDAV
jgi:hypothetical protein